MNKQIMLPFSENYRQIDDFIREKDIKSIFLVCGRSIEALNIRSYFDKLEQDGMRIVRFSDFQPNPRYESVVEGVRQFRAAGCDAIFAVGGGSAMDVAKCIKLFAGLDSSRDYLVQEPVNNAVKLLAVPTTAGTGSEATRYAIIYVRGEKQSITHDSLIPDAVVLDPTVLAGLPLYQKRATLMDALCHAIESCWAGKATEESRGYALEAIRMIASNWQSYLGGDHDRDLAMLKASYIAGQAINITQTTAGHAMCYKLTTLYGIAHGHAAALCVCVLWEYMAAHMNDCNDSRGVEYVRQTFGEIARAMGCDSVIEAAEKFRRMLSEMELHAPVMENQTDFAILQKSVNPDRLKNNPIALNDQTIDRLYHAIFETL